MMWPLVAVAALALSLAVAAWWSRPAWLLWFEQPRLSRGERRRRCVRTAVNHARELIVSGYARDALWWARRARRIDPDDPEALAAMASVLAYRGHYESAVKHGRLALYRAQESGLIHTNAETWSHEALGHATTLLILADEDPLHRDAYRCEAQEWVQHSLAVHPDCRVELNPRLKALASNEWVMP